MTTRMPVRRIIKHRRQAASGVSDAATVIGRIEHGVEISGMTNGQFSLIDMLEHVLDEIGPAHVAISTWTMGIYDLERAARFFADRRMLTSRWLVDPSMFSRRPELAGQMLEAFGVDAFRPINTHAKFATLVNDGWAVAIRSSMNLNPNKRLEHFDISESPELASFFNTIVDDIFLRMDANSRTQSHEVFAGILEAAKRSQDVAAASRPWLTDKLQTGNDALLAILAANAKRPDAST